MHVCIGGVCPDPLAVCLGEAPFTRFCGLVIQHFENGFCGPVVLENHITLQELIILEMKKHAKIMEILAQPQRFGAIFLQIACVELKIVFLADEGLALLDLFQFGSNRHPLGGHRITHMGEFLNVEANRFFQLSGGIVLF